MSRSRAPETAGDVSTERIVDTDVASEMETSFLEYAYSVIYSRALPDARDGLKPVQRRILYQMAQMGLRPDRAHVKCSRVVGEVMGKLHPHGDAAIYDALVRLAQDFSLRLPLIDGHGNFGSLDDGPAAARYTEARLAPSSIVMTAGLDEDVVDFVPNYDNKLMQPSVLPSAVPNLLVNGATGIAVGMATNMAPHNLTEIVTAAKHVLWHPHATLDEVCEFVPGPDLPTGGQIVGMDGIREAYATGRGVFRTRATATIENVTARKKGIVVTELPYLVGPEKVVEKIADGIKNKKIQGISSVQDLTDRKNGLRLIIEIKTGFDPEAVLAQLYRTTPLEESFGINNVALVNGQPATLGLLELLRVWVSHRLDVVRRRCVHRLGRRRDRLHLVEGLLLAIVDIDKVIKVVRRSDDATVARNRLMTDFDLSEVQASYILDLQLRRLTKFSRIELETERDQLLAEIAELEHILADEDRLRQVVADEMDEVVAAFGTPRRTRLIDAAEIPSLPALVTPVKGGPAQTLEVPEVPTRVVLSSSGLIARTATDAHLDRSGKRRADDAIASEAIATTRALVGLVTDHGRILRVPVADLPTTDFESGAVKGVRADEYGHLPVGEGVIAVTSLTDEAPTLAFGTRDGVVKRVAPTDAPTREDSWTAISLKEGDRVIGAVPVRDEDDLVFVSSDASLLRFPASSVRPQGRSAGGMAGIKLGDGQHAVFFGAVPNSAEDFLVVTVARNDQAQTSAKVSPFGLYPSKGRATGGVRSQRFLKGETRLDTAWVGHGPARALDRAGKPITLPSTDKRRDGSGQSVTTEISAVGY